MASPGIPESLRRDNTVAVTLENVTDATIEAIAGLVTEAYDYIALTYVSGGDGDGEIETVTYKDGGSGGTTVATLTLAYNSDDKLSSVTKT